MRWPDSAMPVRMRRVALVAPMMDPVGYLSDVSARLGIPQSVAARVRARSERRIGVGWEELRLSALSRDPGVPALVVHDAHDPEVSPAHGRSIAAGWSQAHFVQTTGLGHNRILRDPAVVERVAAFLADGLAGCECGAPRAADRHRCETCELERDLFQRDGRRGVPGREAARS